MTAMIFTTTTKGTSDMTTRITDNGNIVTVLTAQGETTYIIEERPHMWIGRPIMIRNERIRSATPTYAETRDELLRYIISTAELAPSQIHKLDINFSL